MRSILMCIARMLSAFWRSSRIFIVFLLKCNLCAEIMLTFTTRSLYFFHRWFHWSLWYCAIVMLLLVEIVKKKEHHLHLDCNNALCWMKTFRSTIFLMMSKWEMTWLTFVKRARISSHACLISCVQSLIQLCNVILFCSMFRWTCSELVYVSVSRVSMLTFLNTSATWRRVWFWSVSSLRSLFDSSSFLSRWCQTDASNAISDLTTAEYTISAVYKWHFMKLFKWSLSSLFKWYSDLQQNSMKI